MHTFRVRFSTRVVEFETDRYKDRGQLAVAVRGGAVLPCTVRTWGAKRKNWLNLGLVEQIL